MKDQFKEATILVDQLQNNILKFVSLELAEGQNAEKLGKELKWFADEWVFLMGTWLELPKTFNKREELRPIVEETFPLVFERYDLSYEVQSVAGIIYNTLRLKEFDYSYLDNSMSMHILSSPEGLESLLKFELYLLDSADYYCDSKTKDVLGPLIELLTSIFQKHDFSSNEKALKVKCFEKEGKTLFPVILGFLKKLAERQVPQRNSKILMEANLNTVFSLFEEYYKFYAKYTKDQVTDLDTKIEELKKKDEPAAEKSEEETKKEESKVIEGEEEIKKEEKAVAETEEKIVETTEKVETEEKVAVETTEKVEEKAAEDKKEEPAVKLEDVEAEKKERIENYKTELQKYIDALVQCQQHHLVNLKESFTLGEEFNVVIPHDYWIKLFENASGNLAAYLKNLPQDSDLKGKLESLKSENEIKLIEVSKYKGVNQVYQLAFLYQRLEELFIKEIIGDLNLNKDLIEGLITATKETLESLAVDELTLLLKERECRDFPAVLSGFISNVTSIAINYIVSRVLENNCQFNEDDKFLSMCLDLTESVLSAQKCVLYGLRQDIFSQSNNPCYQDTICLMNAILRANKSLRVEFINRGILQKLFSVEKLSPLITDEAISVLCLMTTLLEDSLVLESQVDLVLKSISKKQEKSEISLEDLLQENNFKPFQNYKRVLEKLKVYGIKSTAETGKTDVSEKDFSLSLPKDDNLVENLQKNLSPVAEECVQILLRTLIQNYSFEKTSSASSQKVTEQKESKRLQELDVKGKLPRGYLYFRDPTPNFEETYEPNVYLDKDSNRTVIQKETGSLVVILSGILTNYPHLIPSVIYQELSYEDVSKQLDNDQDLLSFFKSDSRWSVLDILLRLVLLKEGSSAVFLIASLIQDNIITSAKENQQTIELKYILLIKIFEILENILDSEEKQGKTLETLNSVFMRRNIATIVGFVSNEMNKEDQPSLSSHKEEILQLIMGIARKLLRNPQMIAWSMQDNNPNQSMIRILSSTVKQNTSKSMTLEEVAENYANILKALKTRGSYEPKTFQVNLKETFEKNLSAKKESNNKISHEDQKKFEIWEEKSQYEKEEAQKLFEIAGLKEDKELISEIRLAAYGDVAIGDINLNSIFSEHSWLNEIKNLYKPLDTIKGKPFKSDAKFKIDYFLNRLEASKELGGYQKDSTQSIGVDSEILLPLLKADTKKIENLKNDTLNIAKLYVNEQTGGSQEKVEQPVEKPTEASTEVEKEKDQEGGEKDTAEVKEEAKVEGSSDAPAAEANVEKKEEEKAENQDNSFKYFMDTTIRNEANFKYRVNQAVIQGKRVKEMVCVDKIFKGAEKNSENVIKQFTAGMKEFDRNVVYASLGKTFGADLSEEFRKITEEARKELEDIQKDWSKYEEAKNKIPKPATEESKEEKKDGEQTEVKVEEQKEAEPEKKKEDEEEGKKEDENSEYGEFDYDIQFLSADEKDKEKKENEDSEEEEKKEDAENKDKEEDKKDDAQATLTEVVEGEEAKKDEKSEEAAKKEAETKEKILKTLNSFAVDDSFIMNVFELFFCYFNPSSGNQHLLFDFLKDSLSLNPVNEFKIFDVMITILYTPEFFDCLKGKNFQIEVRSYEKAVEKIIDYISRYFDDAARSYVFFAPKAYLENFGVSFLKDLKETTHFAQKVSDCHTLLDMLLGLIETKLFTENERWIVKILKGMSTLISKEKAVKLAEGVSQVDDYKKTISCKKLLSLLSLIEKPTSKDSESSKQVKDVFMNLKSIPELFVPFQDYLSSHFYQEIIKANKAIDHIIKVFKQNQEKQIGKAEIDEILSHINFPQFELILTIMFSFANVFHFNLLVKEQKESKAAKKLRALLQTVNSSLFNEEEVKVFFISAYELAELIHNNKYQDGLKELWNLLIMVCVGHYSIIIMERNLEEKKPDSSNDLRKQTGGSSLSDVEQMPSLARLVSFEETGEHHEMMAPLQRSYSHYRRELDVDFGTIFANFALKSSTQISNIINDQKTTALKTVLSNLISILIPKYPWIIDLKTKLEIFSNQVQDHFKTYGIENRYYRREITVKRKNLVFSALMQYKEQSREDLLKNLEINFKDERGVDGGGLRRDFYEIVTRQLFDPSAGLFKLASNQISIQPNPMSGLVPYDSTLMQFAGIMLAKAICDSNVVDLNFTKPFLKHILGKKITIADMEEVDADIGKNLRWILENNVEELYLTFTHEIEHLDDRTVIELKEGGSDIFVDEENKKEYVKQICEYRMTKQIKKQLKDFLKGFRMVLPRELISHFSTAELETMIAGESKIDIAEMKKHAYYRNYSQEDQIIIWLFEILEEFSPHQLTTFYYFTSGSTKVPFGGFKDNPIRIYHNSNKEGLPIAHTCSYAIEIPPYDSKDKLREKLLMAIFDGAGEFQIS